MSLAERGDISELVQTGQFEEGLELEAKAASGSIPRNAWETISAFANTIGGVLVLGLVESEDGWRAEGVANPDRIIQDLHNLMRDGTKISHEVSGNGDIWKEEIEGRNLVIVRVQAAPRRHKPVCINGNRELAYVRRNEGDARCTTTELDRMRREATPYTFDAQVIPFLAMDDFRQDTIRQYREMSAEARPDLAHHRLETEAFLRAVGAWRIDRESGSEGPTVAGILMLGEEHAIREIRIDHMIDYRRIPVDETPSRRWIDRVQWSGNLFDAWQEIFSRLARGLPTPFRLRGPQRIDQPAGLEALREAFVNLLVHTDYQESANAVILHRHDGYTFRNPGDSWVDVRDIGIHGRSDRRNPEIAKMFDHIGLADRAGSGFIRIVDEWRELGFRHPGIVSDPARYEFALEMNLASMLSSEDRAWLAGVGGPWREEEELALLFAHHMGFVDNRSLRTATGQHLFDASQTLRSLRDREYLILQGAGRSASYVLGPKSIASNSGDLGRSTGDLGRSTGDLGRSTGDSSGPGAIDEQLREVASRISSRGRANAADVKRVIVELCTITPLSTSNLSHLLKRNLDTVRLYVRELVASSELYPIYPQSRHPQQHYSGVPPDKMRASTPTYDGQGG